MEYKSIAARRSAYLSIMRRRIHPGRGSSLALLRSRESYPLPDLNALFSDVRFVVVGGAATSLYMPRRMTRHVDILVAASDASEAGQALGQAGATSEGTLNIDNPLQIKGASWKLSDGSYLDVLWSARPWVKKALASPNRDSAGLPIISLPYLVLMKLASSRGVDMGDLSRLLGGAEDDSLREVRVVVRMYLPDALEDLDSLAELGRLEFQ
ncbi:MAG: hypothetical protein Q8R28_00750 [Dehalococcoidia bacterium]|nr:hypothetical protein [Dehalococcoidia bacterium]